MIQNSSAQEQTISISEHLDYKRIVLQGSGVGVLTGLVGVGGGFLIIPALIVLSKLPMKAAIGTSLVIISANAFIGFLGGMNKTVIDWYFLLSVSLFAIGGIFIGISLSKHIDGGKLKPAFGWFVLVMGVYILIKELFLK
jgi:hypothetical protein